MNATYIVSCDLHKRIAQLRNCGLVIPEKGFALIQDFQNGLQSLIKEVYPTDKVMLLDIDEMSANVLSLVADIQGGRDIFVVSTSVDFAIPRRGCTLEVNRLVDESGGIIGIGTRPGHIPLETQFLNIAKLAENRPVVLVEDGIFSGKTADYIVGSLKAKKVNVSDVVTCFAFPQGVKKLNDSHHDVSIHHVHTLDHLIEWVPDHDFFPGAPNCGRVVGVRMANSFLPFYDRCGASFSFPYILPFSPIKEWASIPSGFARRFSSFCLRKAMEFFDMLNAANGRRLEFVDLQSINPRISIPIIINPSNFPSRHNVVYDYLFSILREID